MSGTVAFARRHSARLERGPGLVMNFEKFLAVAEPIELYWAVLNRPPPAPR